MSYATPAELAAQLRISVTGANTALLQYCVDAASRDADQRIDALVGSPVPTTDPSAHMYVLARGAEYFKSNDAIFGVIGFDGAGVLPARPASHLDDILTPLIQQFGVG